jgi:tetratricopeptide (TPR) repeat protein
MLRSKIGPCHRPASATRVLGTALVALALAGLMPACAGLSHGRHTQAQVNAAQKRMAQLKSATEYQMANQAFLAGDLPKALKHANFCIELNPEVPKSHVLKGRVLLEMSRIEESAASLAQAQKLDPKNVDAAYYQGLLAERIDRKDAALESYLRAGELDPANAQYAIAAAEMMISLGRTDEAEAYLTARQVNFDHSAGVKQTLGHIAMLREDPATAARLFGEARLLAPDDHVIIEDLIRAQIATGDFGQAEYHIGRLLSNLDYKERRDLQMMRARCLVQLDRPVEAREILVELSKNPAAAAEVETWVFLGQISVVLRDIPRVRLSASRAIALAPTRPEGYVLKAMHLRSTGNPAGAEAALKTAIGIDPSCENYVLLGLVQQDLNRPEDARRSFELAVLANPSDATAGRLLAAFAAPQPTQTP